MRRPHFTDDGRGLPARLRVVAMVAVATTMVLAAGIGVGRATAGTDRPSSVAPAPTLGPVAATPPPAGPVEASGVHPVVAGVPEGWPQTEEGARMAATAFLQVEVGDLIASPDAYRAAWREMCSPGYYASGGREAAETVIAGQESANHLVSNAAHGQRIFVHVFPLTSSVAADDGETATVRTWSLLVSHPGDGPTVASFDAGTILLRWVDGDWRLDGGHGSPSASDGASGALQLAAGPLLPGYLSDPVGTP